MSAESYMSSRASVLQTVVERCRELFGLPDSQSLQEVQKRIKLFAEREAAVRECVLVVVLMGGTKVGKTTMINALAGKVIGAVSSKACFTNRPTVYVHCDREAAARVRLAGVLTKNDRIETHFEDSLERIILVDTPDFDGIEATHHDIFRQILERADLAVCLITTQKYDDNELFKILGESMGFRKTIFVFNRIDEGIPLTEAIKKDFFSKISKFNLKPPDGETLPVFATSALNALLFKLGQSNIEDSEFARLEKYLSERLSAEVVQRINEEHFKIFEQETCDFVIEACGLNKIGKIIPEFINDIEAVLQKLDQDITASEEHLWGSIVTELLHRRTLIAVEKVGGPFGAYLNLSLIVRGLSQGILFISSSKFINPVQDMTERLIQSYSSAITETCDYLRKKFAETADRNGLGVGFIQPSFETKISGKLLSDELQKKLISSTTSRFESVLYNILPILIILLLVRYFTISLLEIREPSAGVFIGGILMLWLCCHIQASFWFKRHTQNRDSILREIRFVFLKEIKENLLAPVKKLEQEAEILIRYFDGNSNTKKC